MTSSASHPNPCPMRVLGLFAVDPQATALKPRLALDLGAEHAARASQAFLRDSIHTLLTTADRRCVCYAPDRAETHAAFVELAGSSFDVQPQSGFDVSTCIEEFASAALLDGATRVVLVNADSPTISPTLIGRAFEVLDEQDAVLAPGRNGNWCVIGLRRVWLGLLHGVRWGTAHAAGDIRLRFQCAEFTSALLPAQLVMDTFDDVEVLRTELAASRVQNPAATVSHTERWLNEFRT